MAAYVIVSVNVTDEESYREYTRQTPGTVEQYGGSWVVRGGAYETLEGDWDPKCIVVLEFANAEQAKIWYFSPEYQAIAPLRQQHALTEFLTVVEGVQ